MPKTRPLSADEQIRHCTYVAEYYEKPRQRFEIQRRVKRNPAIWLDRLTLETITEDEALTRAIAVQKELLASVVEKRT